MKTRCGGKDLGRQSVAERTNGCQSASGLGQRRDVECPALFRRLLIDVGREFPRPDDIRRVCHPRHCPDSR